MDESRIKEGTKFKVTNTTGRGADQIGTGVGIVLRKENSGIWAKMNGATYEETYFTLSYYTFKALKY